MIFGLGKKPLTPRQPGPARPLSTARFGGMQVRELQARLELLVDAALTRRRSVIEPARALAEFSLVEQERFITSVDRISLRDPELAFHFCRLAIPALIELADDYWEPWIDSLLHTFRDKGLEASIADIEAMRSYQQERAGSPGSVAFTDVARVLDGFIRALSGQTLKLATAEQSYTDTETLFIPARINRFATQDENFRLYKALLTHQWAQTRFGTWHIDVADSLQVFPDPGRATFLFHRLETLRLDACLERELPGLAREMAMLRPADQLHPLWREAQTALRTADADAQTSLAWLTQLYPLSFEPKSVLYQGQLCTAKADAVITERKRKTSRETPARLRRTEAGLEHGSAKQAGVGQEANAARVSGGTVATRPRTGLEQGGATINSGPETQALPEPVSRDHGEALEYNPDATNETPEPAAGARDHGTHDFCYDEWDHARQRYRKNWCLLYEQSVPPVAGVFVCQTLHKYRGLIGQLRRTFEVLRQGPQPLKREPFGDDVDIDAVVEAWADIHSGLEASERLFIQTSRRKRHVAVMFMIDMSASTAGWINRVARESLVLLCEALQLLGDRYAIYGFSGRGNKHCQSFHIKNFDEQYNDEVRRRIEGIRPQDYTRLGAAVRHLGARLNRVEARTRLLITLSDGRPDDIDGYLGPYGIEDTRKALTEIRHTGIHSHCITIDTDARTYLPHMFGHNNFTVINQVDKLPRRISGIYRKLTT